MFLRFLWHRGAQGSAAAWRATAEGTVRPGASTVRTAEIRLTSAIPLRKMGPLEEIRLCPRLDAGGCHRRVC
jgi:hypothetical protein